MEFGRNGAVLETDSQTEFEFRGLQRNDLDLCISGTLTLCAYAGLVAYMATYAQDSLQLPLTLICLLIGFVFTIAAPASAFATQAIEEQHLPENPSGLPRHQHIPGSAVAVAAVLVLLVIWLANSASAALIQKSNMEIPSLWGDLVLAAVTAAFLGAIFGPRLAQTTPFRIIESQVVRAGANFHWLGRTASALDSWLVYIVAPAVGVTQRRTRVRYTLLLLNLLPCCVAAWFLPAPLGLLPAAWAFMIITAVARRWAWVEDDRETAMLNANFSSDKLRVGFDEDLSDETLWSYLTLLALIPIAMRQCNDWFGGVLFDTNAAPGAFPADSFFAWLTYYGTELAKSIPFVDWSEIYDVHSAAQISASHPYARHVIFAARAVTDLALLAAFFQVISIASRTKKQMEMFHDPHNPLDRLDPFVEPVELRKLVEWQQGKWVPKSDAIAVFPQYNLARLQQIRGDRDAEEQLRVAAKALIDRHYPEESDATERLLEAVNARPRPVVETVTAAFLRVQGEGKFDIDVLEHVRRKLNWHAGFDLVRRGVIDAIIDRVSDCPERTTVLRNLLADPIVRDSMANSRLRAVHALANSAEFGADERIRKAMEKAARSDAAAVVQVAAQMVLDQLPNPALVE